jgi:hypothetical protein
MIYGTAKRKCLTSARAWTGEHEAGLLGCGAPTCSQWRFHAGPTFSTDIREIAE